MLRTIWGWLGIVFFTITLGIVGLLLSVTSPGKVSEYSFRPWGRWILKACGVKVEWEGLENLPEEPCVIMYNHQSYFDIFAAATLPVEWKGVLKQELAVVPFIGWVPRVMGHYFVARDGSARDTKELRRMVERIRSGPSVLIAPEGTRSYDGKLLPFKEGGFLIAMRAGVPVVVMVIMGGKNVMPRDSFQINPTTMKVKIFPPIDVKNLPPGKEGREELSRIVREAMEKTLAEDERRKVAL
jgi:1-acyl-sn-glycerol-3-phosphate acyltransferase